MQKMQCRSEAFPMHDIRFDGILDLTKILACTIRSRVGLNRRVAVAGSTPSRLLRSVCACLDIVVCPHQECPDDQWQHILLYVRHVRVSTGASTRRRAQAPTSGGGTVSNACLATAPRQIVNRAK